MKTYPVLIAEIKDSTNPLYSIVKFEQETAQEKINTIGILLGKNQTRKRVAYAPVAKEVISSYKLDVGTDMSAAFNMSAKLVVTETFVKSTWQNADGTWSESKAKINPSTGEEILVNGNKVYRNTEFTFDATKQDTLLRESKVAAPAQVAEIVEA